MRLLVEPHWALSLYPDAGEGGGCLSVPRRAVPSGGAPNAERAAEEAGRRRPSAPPSPGVSTRTRPRDARLPRAPAPKSQTPALVASLLGDLGFPAATETTLLSRATFVNTCPGQRDIPADTRPCVTV